MVRRPSPLPPASPVREGDRTAPAPDDIVMPVMPRPSARTAPAAAPEQAVPEQTVFEQTTPEQTTPEQTLPVPASPAPDITPAITSDEPAAEPGEPSLGVRDVWAAARARRRALRAEVRRFTVRQRRRRIAWIAGISAVLLLVLGTIGAAYSPLFAVQRIQVVGTSALDAAAVEQALAGQLGRALPLVDSSEVKAALVQFPLVESYTLEARPPHELVVRIVERTPIGVLSSDAGYSVVDAAGVVLSTAPTPPAGLPLIDVPGGVGSPAFESVGLVYRSLPEAIRVQVTAMSATTSNDVTLTLGATGTEVVWGNADNSAYKAIVLEKAMTARPPAGVWRYDVSSPDAVVIG